MVDPATVGYMAASLASLVGGVVLWLRQNRVADSRANVEVSANFADTSMHNGQAAEIKALRERVSALDTAFVHQAARIAVLEAAHIGANTHFENLSLCEPCQQSNSAILAAIAKALAKADKDREKAFATPT